MDNYTGQTTASLMMKLEENRIVL